MRFSFGITEGAPAEVSTGDPNAANAIVIGRSSAASNSVDLLLATNPNPTILDVATRLDQVIQALRS